MTGESERLTLAAVNAKLEGHEDVCGERYKGIASEMKLIRDDIREMRKSHDKSVSEIKSSHKWVAGVGFSLLVSVAGWGISQQFTALQSDRAADHSQREAERSQREAERTQLQLQQSQINTLAASLKSNVAVNVQPQATPSSSLGPSDPANPAATPN